MDSRTGAKGCLSATYSRRSARGEGEIAAQTVLGRLCLKRLGYCMWWGADLGRWLSTLAGGSCKVLWFSALHMWFWKVCRWLPGWAGYCQVADRIWIALAGPVYQDEANCCRIFCGGGKSLPLQVARLGSCYEESMAVVGWKRGHFCLESSVDMGFCRVVARK